MNNKKVRVEAWVGKPSKVVVLALAFLKHGSKITKFSCLVLENLICCRKTTTHSSLEYKEEKSLTLKNLASGSTIDS